MVITLSHAWVPFAVLPIFVTMEKIDGSLLEAAEDLGDSRFQRFLRLTLPLSTPGLGFAVAWDKPGGFIGKAALLEQRGKVQTKRMVHILMKDKAPLLYHDEPIWRDGLLVGSVTSGSQAYALGFAVGLGELHCPDGMTKEFVNTGAYEIEIAAERHPAEISLSPFFDSGSKHMKM